MSHRMTPTTRNVSTTSEDVVRDPSRELPDGSVLMPGDVVPDSRKQSRDDRDDDRTRWYTFEAVSDCWLSCALALVATASPELGTWTECPRTSVTVGVLPDVTLV
jgi:hypothetical protein